MAMKRGLWIAVGIVIVVIILAVLFSTVWKLKQEEVIKIGVTAALTGPNSFLGQHLKNGLLMAQEEINNAGGVNGKKIQLIIEDTKTNPTEASSAINKLIYIDKVNYIIVMFPDNYLAQPITEKEKKLLIMASMAPDLAKQGKYTVQLWFSQSQEGKAIAKYVVGEGIKRVAILHNNIEAQQREVDNHIIPILEENGVEVVTHEKISLGAADVRTELTKIKESNPDMLIIIVLPNQLEIIFKTIKELNIQVPIIGNIAFAYAGPLDLMNGSVYVAPTYMIDPESRSPQFYEFFNKYKNKYGSVPVSTSAIGYVQLKVLAEVFEKGEGVETVVSNLKNHTFETMIGTLRIDGYGEAYWPISYGIIINGERKLLRETE